MTELLTTAGVDASRGHRQVLHGVDLTLRSGEITALIGPNGAGKSTLLLVLAGLIRHSAGDIDRRGRVAASLQTPALAGRSVRANIRLALRWWKCPRSEWDERTGTALHAIKADQLADRHASTLSGGEARRVHLARALALRPDILLLDEPFAGLDPSTRADLLYDAESALHSEERATLIVVHDRAEAWALADRVAIMLEGRVVQHGSPAEVFEHPATAAVASFVGFTGTLRAADGVRMYRPADVHVVGNGGLPGVVRRAVPVEEGVRLELDMADGTLVAVVPHPAPPVGQQVAIEVADGILVRDEGA